MSKDIQITKYGDPKKGANESIAKTNLELVVRVTSQAKTLCPVDKGDLRNSIMWKVPGQSGGLVEGAPVQEQPKADSGLVGSASDHAIYQEFGTRKQPAQPYLRPAVSIEVFGPNGANTMRKESIKAMKAALNKGRKVYNV